MGESYLGVGWSGTAWLAVAFDAEGFDHAAIFEEIGELWHEYAERANRVLVDVPIGLREEGDTPRQCDELARKVLGPQKESVIRPPVREATRKRRYPAAKRANERKAGVSLSREAFRVSEQIAAVDDLLRNVPEARASFRESRPEVCFRAFAGEELQYSKRTAGGYAERMRTLAGHDPDAPPIVQSVAESCAGAALRVEDVLDAVVLAYTAAPGPAPLRSLPPQAETDPTGLPMEIVYRAPEPLVE